MSFRALRPVLRATATAAARRAVPVSVSALRPLAVRALSSTARRMGSGETDANLASALSAEHRFELENSAQVSDPPAFVEQFRTQGIWDIEDIAGSDDVTLTRKFGNETLKLTFQVSDLDASTFENEVAADVAAAEGSEGETDAEPLGPTALTCSLSITKHAHPNALMVDLETSDEGFEITNVASYERALAEKEGSEGDWERRSKYMGPQFEHLDQAVQEAFGAYLAERGVDEALADFILSYAEHKEQKDYVSWLEQVKGFVEK